MTGTRCRHAVLGITLLACSSARAARTELQVLVLPLAGAEALEAEHHLSLDDLVARQIDKQARFQAHTLLALHQTLPPDRLEELRACHDVACRLQLGRELGFRLVVSGSVSTAPGTTQLTLEALDVRRSAIDARVSRAHHGSFAQFLAELGDAAGELVLDLPKSGAASVTVAGPEAPLDLALYGGVAALFAGGALTAIGLGALGYYQLISVPKMESLVYVEKADSSGEPVIAVKAGSEREYAAEYQQATLMFNGGVIATGFGLLGLGAGGVLLLLSSAGPFADEE